MDSYTVETYTRADGLFGWRLLATNGEIVATDGGQGYTERNDALEGWDRVHDNLADGMHVRVREAP